MSRNFKQPNLPYVHRYFKIYLTSGKDADTLFLFWNDFMAI